MSEFSDQTAVVTGAAQGLGLAIAQLLYARGARVCLLDNNDEKLQQSVTSFDDPERVCAFFTDVTDEKSLCAARDKLTSHWEAPQVLVNNAGTYPHASVVDMKMADWDHVFDVNAKSMLLSTRTFMQAMVERRYGRIVSIVSVDAYVPKPTTPHYAAAKAAVASLTKTFAKELAPAQVLVNGVSPGAIATERAKGESWLKERVKEIPVGRAAEPADIAEVVAFLASSRNRFVVGETVIASGGMVMI